MSKTYKLHALVLEKIGRVLTSRFGSFVLRPITKLPSDPRLVHENDDFVHENDDFDCFQQSDREI